VQSAKMVPKSPPKLDEVGHLRRLPLKKCPDSGRRPRDQGKYSPLTPPRRRSSATWRTIFRRGMHFVYRYTTNNIYFGAQEMSQLRAPRHCAGAAPRPAVARCSGSSMSHARCVEARVAAALRRAVPLRLAATRLPGPFYPFSKKNDDKSGARAGMARVVAAPPNAIPGTAPLSLRVASNAAGAGAGAGLPAVARAVKHEVGCQILLARQTVSLHDK
jgi:hypothetical protein